MSGSVPPFVASDSEQSAAAVAYTAVLTGPSYGTDDDGMPWGRGPDEFWSCAKCGAVVVDQTTHDAWHRRAGHGGDFGDWHHLDRRPGALTPEADPGSDERPSHGRPDLPGPVPTDEQASGPRCPIHDVPLSGGDQCPICFKQGESDV